MRRCAAWWMVWGVLAVAPSVRAAAPPAEVMVRSLGANRMRIEGSILVDQPPATLWAVLTDYNRLHEFIPGLTESRLIATPSHQRLTQRGVLTWWAFRLLVQVTLEVTETPPSAIRFTAVSGDFLEHQGAWRLEPVDHRTRVRYDATLRPRFFIPPVIGAWMLKRQMRRTLEAVAARAVVAAPEGRGHP